MKGSIRECWYNCHTYTVGVGVVVVVFLYGIAFRWVAFSVNYSKLVRNVHSEFGFVWLYIARHLHPPSWARGNTP